MSSVDWLFVASPSVSFLFSFVYESYAPYTAYLKYFPFEVNGFELLFNAFFCFYTVENVTDNVEEEILTVDFSQTVQLLNDL